MEVRNTFKERLAYVSPSCKIHRMQMKRACLIDSNLFGSPNCAGAEMNEPGDGDDYYYGY